MTPSSPHSTTPSSPTSADASPSLPTPPSTPSILPSFSSETLSTLSSEPEDLISSLLEKPVHEMSPQELAEYVRQCSNLRKNASEMKKAVAQKSTTPKQTRSKAKEDSVAEALSLLQKLGL